MQMLSVFFLAVGLAMDATAVAATRGLLVSQIRVRHMLLVAVFFGGFQTLMPLLGWFLGAHIGPWVEAWDHWIVFALLVGLGAKMLHEAWRADPDTETAASEREVFALRVMLALGVATSIDAFAAGITLPLSGAPLGPALVMIGVVTAVLSVAGLLAGRRFGALLGSRLDAIGGLMLIALGVKALFEHLLARS